MIQSAIRKPQSEVIRVLLVEDDPGDVRLIQEMLKKATHGIFALSCVDHLEAGLKYLGQREVDVLLLDLGLPDARGIDTFLKAHSQSAGVPIIVLTGLGDESLGVRAVREGAQNYLLKGQLDGKLLERSIRYAIERQRILVELEQRTWESQALLHSLEDIIQKNPDGVIIVDRAGVVRFVNTAAESLLHRKAGELIGRTFGFPIVPGEKMELDIVRRGKEPAIVEMHVVEVEWEGEIVYLAALRDITDRKRAEEALRQSEERYRVLVDSAPDAIVLVDAEGKVVSCNSATERFTGYRPEELEGKSFLELGTLGPEQLSRARKLFEDIMSGQEVEGEGFETTFRHKDGTERWVSVKVRIVRTGEEMAGILVVARDITERKVAEETLRQSEEKYRALFDSTVVGTFVVDAETMKVVLGNQAAAETFGFNSVEEARGVNPLDFVSPEDRERALKIMVEDMFEKDLRQASEFRAMTKDGREVWINAVGTRIVDGGKVRGLVAFIDITERKKGQERLEDSLIDLVETVSRAIETRDPYTAGHQRRVAELAHLVGERMGLDEDRLQGLYIGGFLHDIGKVAIPAGILTKLGELTEEEWALICTHAKQGYNILKDISLPWPVADMALNHHERLDGSGYPHGIKGDKLSLEVRILAVCDVVEAMGSHRPYRPARSKQEVMEEIQGGRGTKYDAEMVDAVLQIIGSGEFDFGWEAQTRAATKVRETD